MADKQEVRREFVDAVMARDRSTCQGCGVTGRELDAHHILNRSLMPAGGYVKENGIALCQDECHPKAERYHKSEGTDWVPGFHPDELFRHIGTRRRDAIQASLTLARRQADHMRHHARGEYPNADVAAFWSRLPGRVDDVDWPFLYAACPWLFELDLCPQDRLHHQEGDVGRHTRLVFQSLFALDAFNRLSAEDREVLMVAVLLHDIAKPATLEIEEGERIRARNHASRGALMARRVLWERGYDPGKREQVCQLITHHMQPFHLIDQDPVRAHSRVVRMSQTTRLDLLEIHARADAMGREAPEKSDTLENVSLFAEMAREVGCLYQPYPYPSLRQRFLHQLDPDGRQPESPCQPLSSQAPVCWIMAGLPASGKSSFHEGYMEDIRPISLDAIRAELGIGPEEKQGRVIQEAFDRAKESLRRGESIVWNATNIVRKSRERIASLAADYGALVKIVHVEAPADLVFERNRQRSRSVPDHVLADMAGKWEVPMPGEADEVWAYVDTGSGPTHRPLPGRMNQRGYGYDEHGEQASCTPN